MWPLFEEAKARGVTRMLVNHPTFVIDATVDDVRDLARMGVWVEHSFCMFINEPYSKFFTGQDLKALITAAGVDRTILGSDLGQINNPRPVASFRSVVLLLLGLGYGKDDIRKLISLNEDYEVRDWCKSLNTTPEKLKAAVKAVGNSADKVREYLA